MLDLIQIVLGLIQIVWGKIGRLYCLGRICLGRWIWSVELRYWYGYVDKFVRGV